MTNTNCKYYRTSECPEENESLKILHLKPTGTAKGEGLVRACKKYGDGSYYMGGYFWYFLLRVIGRSLERRTPIFGYYMLRGYFKAKRNKEVRETEEFRTFLKKVQIQNLLFWIKLLFQRKK